MNKINQVLTLMPTHKLIIKQQRSRLWNFCLIAGALLVLVVSFYLGKYLAVENQQMLLDKTVWLQQKLDEYQQAYQKASESLVMQTQFAKVDDQSSLQLLESIKQLQQEKLQLEGELQFYRNIMAPELSQKGLTIAKFELSQASSADSSIFKLVLTQAGKQDQFIKGNVELELSGKLNGLPKTFKFSELGTFKPSHFKFQFRYFQNIEGEIELPQGFIAEQIMISATTRGLKKNQIAIKKVDWNI